MTKPDIHRLLEFQKLLLKFSQIERVVSRRQGDHYINENDSEHSYNLTMTAWFLAPHFPELDKDLVIKCALVHDLVEIHAGDTYAYGDQSHIESKVERETAALLKLEAEWPDLSEITDLMHSYELHESNEAKFVYALDKVMPIMQIYLNDGKTWHDEGLTIERLHAKKERQVVVSPEIEPYYKAPLGGVGTGSLPISSAGINAGITRQIP